MVSSRQNGETASSGVAKPALMQSLEHADTTTSTEADSSNGEPLKNHSKQIIEPPMNQWRPSILRVAPLTGLTALAFTILQIAASYAVLAASNGDEVINWKYQPTVYLAILTAISNKALAFAAIQGVVVTFWLRVLRGTTLKQLHLDGSYGLYVYKAICSGRNCSLLAVACICATVVVMDGPLLQRASSVRSIMPDSPISLTVTITPELPSYFTGLARYEFGVSNKTDAMQFRNEFVPIFQEHISNAPMEGAITGCKGKCELTVLAPALTVDHCTSTLK